MFSRRSREFKSGEGFPNGFSNGSDSDTKLDEGTIQAVEESLRDALTLNNEEARALMGRIEYQKQNFESALQILDGVNLESIFPRVKSLPPSKTKQKRGKPPLNSPGITLPASVLLLEAAHLKIKALELLGRESEATHQCSLLSGSFAESFPRGLPEHLKTTRIQELLNKLLELLPELLKRQSLHSECVAAYRRALVGCWPPDSGFFRTLQLQLAVLLLYGGVDSPPCPPEVYGTGYSPSSNVEEAVYLLVSITRSSSRASWDPEVMEHLCFALGTCRQFRLLAEEYETLLPGLSSRTDRWFDLALCYIAAGDGRGGLNLLRKILSESEKPGDVLSLLHAASICSGIGDDIGEGVMYCRKAVENSEGAMGFLKGRAWQLLGVLLSMKARSSATNSERSLAVSEALRALREARKLERLDPDVVFYSGLLNAEQGNLKIALENAKSFLELSGASSPRGWRFLALVLSAQGRYEEAELIIDAALQETSRSERGELLMTKGKLQAARGKGSQALGTYKQLLTLVSNEKGNSRGLELNVLQEIAALSTASSQFNEAERLLEKAKLLNPASARTWNEYGNLFMAQGKNSEALSAYNAALSFDPEHFQSKIEIGSLLCKLGSSKSFPVARSYLNDALRSHPKNSPAWFHLGVLHEEEGRFEQAAECFKTAFVLDQSAPVEEFSTLLRA